MEWKYMLVQPERLQSLAINSLAVWIISQAKKLLFPILQLVKENPTKTKTMISSQIEIIRRHLYCSVPNKFYDTLLSKVITNINNELIQNTLQNDLEPLTEYQRSVVGRTIETLFTENITSLTLDFHQFVTFRESLYNNSQRLTNLANVNISFSKKSITTPFRSYNADANEKEIIEFVKNLHNLKNLSLQYVCTDKILICLTKNCKLIEKLDVFSSKVNDKSIKILTELHNLKIINLGKTLVSNKGIEKLLLACKNLEHISHDGRIVLSEVMKKIALSKEKNPKLFKLKTYRSCMDSLDQLKCIIQMSPHLQNIQTIVENAEAVTDSKHLKELTLSRGGYYSGQVSNVLKMIGFDLVHLSFFQLSELDLNAVIDISQTCPNLESLSIEGCRFESSEINETRNKIEVVPFRKLNRLTLDMKDSFRPIEICTITRKKLNEIHEPVLFLLSNCVNIEFLECDIPVWLTEHVMLQILDHNQLKCLQEMNVWSTRMLPELVTEKIVQNCTNRAKIMQTEESRRLRWI